MGEDVQFYTSYCPFLETIHFWHWERYGKTCLVASLIAIKIGLRVLTSFKVASGSGDS